MIAAAIRYEHEMRCMAFVDEDHLMMHLNMEMEDFKETNHHFQNVEEVLEFVNEQGIPFDVDVLDLNSHIEIDVCSMARDPATGDFTLADSLGVKSQEDILFIDVIVKEVTPATGQIEILEEHENLTPAQEPLGSIVVGLEEKYDVDASWI